MCSKHKKIHSKDKNVSVVPLKKHFHLDDKIVLKSTSKVPIYSIADIFPTDSSYFIIDNKNYKILQFKRDGEFVNSWGRKGKGPGELLDPEWISVKGDSIYVLDGQGNFRMQIYNKTGSPLGDFPLRSSGPFSQSYIVHSKNGLLFLTTTIGHCGTGNERCIMQVQDFTGTVMRRFGKEKKVAPNHVGLPFYSAFSEKKLLYLAHVYGKKVSVYDLEGSFRFSFSLDQSNFLKPLNQASMPTDVFKQAKELQSRTYTSIANMYADGKYLFIQFETKNPVKATAPKWFMDIYDLKGNLKFSGIKTPYFFLKARNDKFYFVVEDEQSSIGKFTIYEYEFKEN